MTHSKRQTYLVAMLSLLALALAASACGAALTSAPQGGSPSQSLAPVDSVDLTILESFPVQVMAVVDGYLPDGCTTIDQIAQQLDGDTIKVTITTTRPADKVCTQALVPYEEKISLDVLGLAAGTYIVDVNGVTAAFTLAVENSPQG